MTDPLSQVRSLIELADKCTAGPWRTVKEDTDNGLNCDWLVQAVCGKAWDNIAACGGSAYEDGWKYTDELRKANAEFIAAAHNSVEAIRELMERLKEAEEVVDAVCKEESCADIDMAHAYRQKYPEALRQRLKE